MQGHISCLRCHGTDSNNFWQPLSNDVAKLIESGRFSIPDDISELGQSPQEVEDVLLARYSGNPDTIDGSIGRARRNFAASIDKITGPDPLYQQLEADKVVSHLMGEVAKVYDNYTYSAVTPKQACIELGVTPKEGEGPQTLERILGFQPGEVVDPIFAYLLAGISVNRSDFEQVFPEAASRAAQTRQEFTKENPMPPEKVVAAVKEEPARQKEENQ